MSASSNTQSHLSTTVAMPRPGLPLTPGSSSDIKGKDGIQQLSSYQLSFELPPPAIHDASRVSPTDSTKLSPTATKTLPPMTTSPSTINFPMQPAETVKARRRSSVAKEKDNTFALPPPPTRSRKIIQMKPRVQESEESSTSKDTVKTGGRGAAAKKTAAAATAEKDATGEKGKKKQPSATSAAGRKIARKTAHSLIERRRRSKMNEEFAVLKGMIPACTGEMHKLSILQASIEYIRYLEDCVSKLKAQQEEDQGQTESGRQTPTNRDRLPSIREFHPTFHADDMDVDMDDSDIASPPFNPRTDHPSAHSSVSPAILSQDDRNRQHSYSSVSTGYSYSASAGTSPAFGPQAYAGYASAPSSALTSPALNPQNELDQEAMAALLMLNNSDRRSARGRALSVRDLLST